MAADSPTPPGQPGTLAPRPPVPPSAPDPDAADGLEAWSEAALRAEAESLGADVADATRHADLIAALRRQRKAIRALAEADLRAVLTWAGLPLPQVSPSDGLAERKERLARAVARVKTMRFGGLSHEGLRALAVCRGVPVRGDEPVTVLVNYLKARESLREKFARKRRSLMGMLAEKVIGLTSGTPSPSAPNPSAPERPLRHDIEDQGLLAGLAGRLRQSADQYVQEKLDEIEARIDRKLDEIDRRLSDWRDREIANRIRIIKITLWASVVISALSLLYLYIKTHLS